MDLKIDGYLPVRGIPIELGGVRSYLLESIPDPEDALNAPQKKKRKGPDPQKPPLAVLCQVTFESQTRKEVVFHSSLLIANNSQHLITILDRADDHVAQKQASKMVLHANEDVAIARGELTEEDKVTLIAPGTVFHVPLSWFQDEKSLYVQRADGNFHRLFTNVRQTFAPSNMVDQKHLDSLKSMNIDI
jgi:hypothetical protein